MIEFLKSGKNLKGVEMGMTINNLHSILGKPTNVSREKNYGYIHYGEYRYGFKDDIINEMAIEFKFIQKPIEFQNLEYKKYDISLLEDFKIKPKSKIHEIISFINHLQLNWKAQNGIDKDCLTIKIENGPYIVFDLYNGTVDKITIVDGHQKD
jgi:hypothetical protein